MGRRRETRAGKQRRWANQRELKDVTTVLNEWNLQRNLKELNKGVSDRPVQPPQCMDEFLLLSPELCPRSTLPGCLSLNIQLLSLVCGGSCPPQTKTPSFSFHTHVNTQTSACKVTSHNKSIHKKRGGKGEIRGQQAHGIHHTESIPVHTANLHLQQQPVLWSCSSLLQEVDHSAYITSLHLTAHNLITQTNYTRILFSCDSL